jgi:hypothetical protein
MNTMGPALTAVLDTELSVAPLQEVKERLTRSLQKRRDAEKRLILQGIEILLALQNATPRKAAQLLNILIDDESTEETGREKYEAMAEVIRHYLLPHWTMLLEIIPGGRSGLMQELQQDPLWFEIAKREDEAHDITFFLALTFLGPLA